MTMSEECSVEGESYHPMSLLGFFLFPLYHIGGYEKQISYLKKLKWAATPIYIIFLTLIIRENTEQ